MLRLILAVWLCLSAGVVAAGEPALHWSDAAVKGWAAKSCDRVEKRVRALAPTALIVVADGATALSWGDTARKVNVRSMRKSVLSALYGIAAAEGRIDLGLTLERIGIDDREPSLSPAEKQATIRDLLMARSGVYHPAAYETRMMKARRPPRGSAAPGTVWYYNNWDFNALGVIYERLTGEDLYDAVERRLARPLGMQDFTAADGQRVFAGSSDFPAHTMRFSARDLARFGTLFLDGGAWRGRAVVPAAWVADSTRTRVATDAGILGYGYLWWTLPDDGPWGPGVYLALGHGGQALAVMPSRRLVLVQLDDVPSGRERLNGGDVIDLLTLLAEAVPAR